MNIKLSYLYRDGANYKQYNNVIFANPDVISLNEIRNRIKKSLIESTWFVAHDWGLPDMHFKEYVWDNETDHDWHEFEYVKESGSNPTEDISILDFLIKIENIRCRN